MSSNFAHTDKVENSHPSGAANATRDPQTIPRPATNLGTVARTYGPQLLVSAVAVGLLVALVVYSPVFFEPRNLLNVARQASIIGVVAVGMTLVILTSGIDLSVGSTLALSAVIVATLVSGGVSPGFAALAGVALGAVAGVVNGVGVAHLRIQPFVMTLATMVGIRGVALRITDGGPRIFSTDSRLFATLGSGDVLGVPGPFVVFLILAASGWVLLRYTTFGRYLYAIGGSAEAARLSGVPIRRTIITAYAVTGGLAGMAGVLTAARLSSGDPSGGSLLELDAIAAVVIGGTSLLGGVGGMGGTVLGALLLALVANVLNLFGVSPFDQLIVKGAVIVLAVLLGAQAAKRRFHDSRDQDPGSAEPGPVDPTRTSGTGSPPAGGEAGVTPTPREM